MKKNIVIIGAAVLVAILGYSYYWYTIHPLRARPSKEGEACHEKCRAILHENLIKCGDDCLPVGEPFFAYDKVTGKCVSKVEISKDYYRDWYINDCNTNTYISRWNPTPKDLITLTAEGIDTMELEWYQKNKMENFIDFNSNNVEVFWISP